MAETKIEWATYTFNPWLGCTKVSPACTHCYAESWAKRSGLVQWGDNPRRKTTDQYWRQPLKWNELAKSATVRPRVFCASLADVFETNEEVAPWRKEFFNLISKTPNLDWLLLTKRPENIRAMLPNDWGMGYPNIWLGATVENQEYADKRIPNLLEIDAKVYFVSCEPLLGELNLEQYLYNRYQMGGARPMYNQVNWVICGGESGPGARPMHPAWARSLQAQCEAATVPFHFKQWGEFSPNVLGINDSVPPSRIGKKAAGRILDGRTWDEFPEVAK